MTLISFPSFIHKKGPMTCSPVEMKVPLFKPVKRSAILVNMWTETGYRIEDHYDPLDSTHGTHLGDRQVLMLEALLTDWRINFNPSVNRIMDDYLGPDRENFKRGMALYQADSHFAPIDQLAKGDPDLARQSRGAITAYCEVLMFGTPFVRRTPYEQVVKIPPFSATPTKLVEAMTTLAGEADDDSFALLFTTSHGSKTSIAGNYELSHRLLLNQLDRLPGKKLIICFACFSGSLIEALKHHPNRQNYLVVTSTSKEEEGTNWTQDELLKEIVDQIAQNRPVSQFDLSSQNIDGFQHTPEIFGYFDVVI